MSRNAVAYTREPEPQHVEGIRGSVHIQTVTVPPGYSSSLKPTNNYSLGVYRDPATGRKVSCERLILPLDDFEMYEASREPGWDVKLIQGVVIADRITFFD